MPQTTSNVGRLSVAFPDRGFDAAIDGGSALHTALTNTIKGLSDNIANRWFDNFTLTSTQTTTLTHNFGLALTSLKVLIMESGVLKTGTEVASRYTISQVSTSAISIQNVSGGTISNIQVYIIGYPLGVKSADIDSTIDATVTRLSFSGGIILSNMAEPSSPSASKLAVYVDTVDGKLKAKDSSGTVSIYATSVGSFTTGNVSANDSDVVFTSSSNRTQICNPTAARTYQLPTTGISAGEVWTFFNRSTTAANIITVQSSGANTIDYVLPNGELTLVALVGTPTTASDWKVISASSAGFLYTPSSYAGLGTPTNVTLMVTRNRNLMNIIGSLTTGSVTATVVDVALYNGFSVNSSLIRTGTTIVGTWGRAAGTSPFTTLLDSTSLTNFRVGGNGGGAPTTEQGGTAFGSTEVQSFVVNNIPISGWN